MKKIFLILIFILMVLSFFFAFAFQRNNFNIPLFGTIDSDIRLNIETKGSLKVFVNNVEIKPSPNFEFNSFNCYEINNFPVYKISFSNNDIEKMVVSVGDKLFYFPKKEIKNFKKDETGNFEFPKNVKYYKNSAYITDKGKLHGFFINFLSIFYNPFYFILPIICLILLLLNFKFNLFKNNAILWGIILLGLILRFSDLTPNFWSDELYTIYMAGRFDAPFLNTFIDPGNPPLYFILSKIWTGFFGVSPLAARLLPLIFSLFSIPLIYLFLNKTKFGLLAAFIFSINLYSLITAKEARCYSLCIFLTLALSIFLFKIIDKPNNKNFIYYFLISTLAFNCHFYMAFVLFANFIFGEIFLNKKNKIKFLLVNFLSFLTLLPYLFVTGLKKGLMNKSFNNFNFPDFNFYIDVIQKYQGKFSIFIILFALVFVLCPKLREKFIENENLKHFNYSIYLIFSTFILTFLFSFIRPITKDFYFVSILPFFLISLFLIPFLFKNKKLKAALFILVIISYFAPNNYIKRERARLLNFDNIVSYYIKDKNESSALIVPHSKEMLPLIYKNLSADELVVCPLPQEKNELINLIKNINKKNIYLKVEYNVLPSFLIEISKLYKASFIRLDKDVIILKVFK